MVAVDENLGDLGDELRAMFIQQFPLGATLTFD